MGTELITANHAAGLSATLAGRANRRGRGFGSGVYPITPQTESIEYLCAQKIEKGHVMRVESEHSAMAACMGFSLAGMRSFTASSSNGLSYMTENVFAASFYRLPIVMMAVNRTLGPPWNIWVDHGDTLALRDSGWIQFYCEDNQEVFDSILLSYRLAEDHRILLPAMVCQDAFVLSHTMMPTEIPDQEDIDSFLPLLDLPHRVTDKPITIGCLDFPHETEVHRKQHADAFDRVIDVYSEVQDSFESSFGRRPADPVVPYKMEDAEMALVSMGTTGATVKLAVDMLREKGIAAGGLRVRMFRPFPSAALEKHLAGVGRVGVLDRNISPGLGGIVWGELRGFLSGDTLVQDYIIGLGGGDIRPEHIVEVARDLGARTEAEKPTIMEVA